MADPIATTGEAELLEQLRRENESLRAELEETNQGVLALYAELDTQAEQLRQASELKSRFLSYMSHEFRTPLGSILSITRLLSDELDGPLSPEQHKQVRFVSSAASELSEMVDDLLDLAKIEAGRVSISPAWFDMLDLFSALRGMFRPIVEGSPVDLIFEEPQGLPRFYTDDKKLAQILRNFISNALKFTTQGEVRVSARMETPQQVRFAVTDTGIGIHSCTIACSRTSPRSIPRCRSACAARVWDSPCANASPSCWAVGSACRASPARVRSST